MNEIERAIAEPHTNADRIRAMSDEELADLLREVYDAGADDEGAYNWGLRHHSFIWKEDWLQQPAEEGGRAGHEDQGDFPLV